MWCLIASVPIVCAVGNTSRNTWNLPADHQLLDYVAQKSTRNEGEIEVLRKLVIAFRRRFPIEIYAQLTQDFDSALSRYTQSKPYTLYRLDPDQPRCEKKSPKQVVHVAVQRTGGTFPGGIIDRIFGFDFGKMAFDMLEKASGPAQASSMPVQLLTATALSSLVGMVKAVISAVISTVPPMIPPPIWINQPLPCLPMLTGHNCFGAVLGPITAADFVSADVSDKSVAGYIAGFPKLYYAKVGTSKSLYRACFAAYMSMHCASIFPMCTLPLSRDEPIPVGGSAPMCFYHCIMVLVACPGFWIEDIEVACTNVALGIPPMCTTANFWNMALLPPQYTGTEEEVSGKCPKQDHSFGGLDTEFDSDESVPRSPILEQIPPSGIKP